MPEGSAMFVFQNLYEPTQKDGKWVVYFKKDKGWEEKSFDIHEDAYDFYYRKSRELANYYNVFLRELGLNK